MVSWRGSWMTLSSSAPKRADRVKILRKSRHPAHATARTRSPSALRCSPIRWRSKKSVRRWRGSCQRVSVGSEIEGRDLVTQGHRQRRHGASICGTDEPNPPGVVNKRDEAARRAGHRPGLGGCRLAWNAADRLPFFCVPKAQFGRRTRGQQRSIVSDGEFHGFDFGGAPRDRFPCVRFPCREPVTTPP